MLSLYNILLEVSPSPSGGSTQKRLTEFTRPAKKRLRVETLAMTARAGSTQEMLSASPADCSSTTADPACKNSHRKVDLITLSDSPETTRPAKAKCTGAENRSTKRVELITLSSTPTTSPTTTQHVAPRRVALTPVSKAVSPRRVALTTLSSPPRSQESTGKTANDLPCNQQVVTPKSSAPFNQQAVTPKSSTCSSAGSQTGRSPRRVQLTTLSNITKDTKPADEKPTNTLTERSQNTLTAVVSPLPMKCTKNL